MAVSGWRLSRGRAPSGTDVSLVVCGLVALGIVLLGKAESSIFDSIRAKLSDWTAPVLEGVREPLAGMQDWVENLGGIFSVYEENIRLKQEVAELKKWQEVAGSLQRRVERYELLLKAVPDIEMSTIQARVIGQSSRPFVKTMILNAGKAHGVKPGQAVIDDRGLIGRIYLTGERTSWVILLSDLDSRVPVMIEPSNRRALMTGDNSTAPALLLDTGVAVRPKAGDRVFSSGDGGLLPPGLPVGVVVDDGGDLHVALFADPDATDYVQIVEYQIPDQPPAGLVTGDMPVAPRPAPPPEAVPAPATQGAATPNTTPAAAAVTPAPRTSPAPTPARRVSRAQTTPIIPAPRPANTPTVAPTPAPPTAPSTAAPQRGDETPRSDTDE